MKMKMYQVPVTEMYAVRAQLILSGSEPDPVVKPDKENGPFDSNPNDPFN